MNVLPWPYNYKSINIQNAWGITMRIAACNGYRLSIDIWIMAMKLLCVIVPGFFPVWMFFWQTEIVRGGPQWKVYRVHTKSNLPYINANVSTSKSQQKCEANLSIPTEVELILIKQPTKCILIYNFNYMTKISSVF